MHHRAALLAALVVASTTLARANGRFPATNSVNFRPADDRTILVGTTFGPLLSTDGGATWGWMCEMNVGYTGTFDPVYAIAADGAMYAATYQGLSITRDGGCSWSFAPSIGSHWISDVVVGPDGAVWAVTATTGVDNDAFVSRDGGASFAPVGLVVPRGWWKAVRVAPSDPMRVYVSGYQLDDTTTDGGDGIPRPLLYRSDDGGAGWIEIPFDVMGESQLRIAAVSPADPDLVFARIDRMPDDLLLRSDDGGVSWTIAVTFTDDVRGVVARADGQTVIAGAQTGGPEMHGDVALSSDMGLTWNRDPDGPKLNCLAEQGDELYACGANWTPDRFAFGRSTDGLSWTKVFRFCEIDGPLECPAGTPQAEMCERLWPMLGDAFGMCVSDAGPPLPDAGPRPDAGQGGNGKGCGCGVSLALVVVALPRRQRRRRS